MRKTLLSLVLGGFFMFAAISVATVVWQCHRIDSGVVVVKKGV